MIAVLELLAGVAYTMVTGDYPGVAVVGVEEDSALVSALLSVRGA